MKRILTPMAILLLLAAALPATTCAQSPVESAPEPVASTSRPGALIPIAYYYQANPVVEVAKSTLYGGLAGLALGLAASLVVEDSGGSIRWGFVVGTFGGFIWGVVHYSKSSNTQALLEAGTDRKTALRMPNVEAFRLPDGSLAARVPLIRVDLGKR